MNDRQSDWRQPLFNKVGLRFRHKILLGMGLTLISGMVSGAVAVFNVREVGNSVNFSVEAASPLLIGAISLSESYQKLQSVFDPVMKNCAGLEGAARFLNDSEVSQARKLDTLKPLAKQADAQAELGRYEFSGQKIFRTRKALLNVCHRNTALRAQLSSAETGLKTSTGEIAIIASKNVLEIESGLSGYWNRAAQSGFKLPDVPALDVAEAKLSAMVIQKRLRDFYRIKLYMSEINMAHVDLEGVNKQFDLERKLKSYRVRTASLETSIRELRPHFAEYDRTIEYNRMLAQAYNTRYLLYDGPESLFSSFFELIKNERDKEALVTRLQREQGQYSVALLNIMDVAQRINRNAQMKTERFALIAIWEIAAGVFISAILALIIGWYFKSAVTKPLELLTGNVSRLGQRLTGDTKPVDEVLLKRGDEIGDLANQFAQTFQALADARLQLQEASQAEIAMQRDRLHGAIENMPQGLYMLDATGRIVVANRQLASHYHLGSANEIQGMTVPDFIALCRSKGAGVRKVISDEVVSPAIVDGRATKQRLVELDDGRFMTMTVMPLSDGGYVVTHEDITEKKSADDRIAHLALHDSLTGLANRTLFRNHVARYLETASSNRQAALLFLDLDRFKVVNDTLGHPIGDALLVQVANRLKSCLNEDSFAARLGGDEFAVFHVINGDETCIDALSSEIIRKISEPFDICGHHINIGTSIGVAIHPRDGNDPDELLKNADLALYCAKQEGRGQFRFFEPDMDRRMRDFQAMERDLREAIQLNQFELYFQPMVHIASGSISGYEALVRWHHPTRGFVSPADFIPVAEEAGLIHELGSWILDEACRVAMTWPSHIVVSVNISPIQFGGVGLPLAVASALSKSGLPCERLMLEITEGVFLNDSDHTMMILAQLKALGVSFAMDDFGTGYSSLSYIRKFPFDRIKIDQSFLRDLSDNPESLAIVRAVTNLCRDLGMKTTAEGVETIEQVAILQRLGCGYAQGYHFGRPMTASAVLEQLADVAHRPLKVVSSHS